MVLSDSIEIGTLSQREAKESPPLGERTQTGLASQNGTDMLYDAPKSDLPVDVPELSPLWLPLDLYFETSGHIQISLCIYGVGTRTYPQFKQHATKHFSFASLRRG